MKSEHYDVAIIGGGPGGSTTGSILRKYDPSLRVFIAERERFPREHVGESMLPPIGAILDEVGVWNKVEAAGFPIKIGATYRWGQSKDLWDFEFIPVSVYRDGPRPQRFEGQRRMTAFQVDRAVYDKILLDHARELGCDVYEETGVTEVLHDGDRVTGLRLSRGDTVRAAWYIDASGHAGILRRSLGVATFVPTQLKNLAMWDYWTNAEWAVTVGRGATRVQVLSVGFGWIWFIPLSETRTSIGLICPAEYYKQRGVTPEALYQEALALEPRVTELTRNATRENLVRVTRDWSFISDRMCGENWFLVGESAGFADPILAGGLTLTHTGARECAYNILSIRREDQDPDWIRSAYEERQKRLIGQYIRFADYWYAFNGQMQDLKHCTKEIAQTAGLDLTPDQAFRWLSFGGLSIEDFLFPGLGTLDIVSLKMVNKMFTGAGSNWELNKYNTFTLNLGGASKDRVPLYSKGRVTSAECFLRNGSRLPVAGLYKVVLEALGQHSHIMKIGKEFSRRAQAEAAALSMQPNLYVTQAMATLEALLVEGWVEGRVDSRKEMLAYDPIAPGSPVTVHPNRDPERRKPPAA